VMLSPSIRFRAHICRFPMTCVFARLIRRPSLRNCGQFRGQAGTTSCEPGGCRSVRLRSFGAGGRASKRLPDMPSPKKGIDAEKPQGTLKLTRPRKSGLPNVGVIAIHCQLRFAAAWSAGCDSAIRYRRFHPSHG
jgi:hypothetical protein